MISKIVNLVRHHIPNPDIQNALHLILNLKTGVNWKEIVDLKWAWRKTCVLFIQVNKLCLCSWCACCFSQMTEKASIQRLTESFVTKLQADFPSTVSTIYRSVKNHNHCVDKHKISFNNEQTCFFSCRTSEKLQTACKSSSTADHCDRCLFCLCALDTAVGKCTVK